MMQNRYIHYACSLLIGCCCFLASCQREDIYLNKPNEEVRTLGAFLSNNYAYSLFAAALEYTGLIDTLNSRSATFTVLAPLDAAFHAIGIERADDFLQMDKDSLRTVLAYHILPFRLTLSDIPKDQIDIRYETLAGGELYANRYTFRNDYRLVDISNSKVQATMVTFSGAEVENAISLNNVAAPLENVGDIALANGLVHSLVKLIKPFPDETVQDWLAGRPEYSSFVKGLKKFGLWEALGDRSKQFTVFAPKNEILDLQGMSDAFIEAMDVQDYLGARLFGSYIMYDRQFFIKDYHFYLATQDQFWYVDPVRDDPAYNRVFMGQAIFGHSTTGGIYMPSFANRFLSDLVPRFYDYDYTLGVTDGDTPYLYFKQGEASNEEAFLGGGTVGSLGNPYMNRGLDQHQNDNWCNNGIVHNIDAVLVLPEEALTDEN